MIIIKLLLIIYCSFNAEGYVRQAENRYDADDMRGAMEYIEKAIELNPKLPSIYLLRAKVREEINDPDFEDDFNYAIDLENEQGK